MSLQWKSKSDITYDLSRKEIVSYSLERKKKKGQTGYLLLHTCERDVYRCLCADLTFGALCPASYEKFVHSLIIPYGVVKTEFRDVCKRGFVPLLSLQTGGKAGRLLNSTLLVNCLFDEFFSTAPVALDDGEAITAREAYAPGSLKVREFKNCFKVRLTPHQRELSFNGFRALFRKGNKENEKDVDSSDDESTDNELTAVSEEEVEEEEEEEEEEDQDLYY